MRFASASLGGDQPAGRVRETLGDVEVQNTWVEYANVLSQVKNGAEVLAVLAPGDAVGEMSLLARRPASFDVIAVERTVALSLSREKFDEVAVDHPTLLAEVYKLLVQRENDNLALVHDANDLVV